ncbi:unnamed protein product, partial [Rotaria magnacalcarata]
MASKVSDDESPESPNKFIHLPRS